MNISKSLIGTALSATLYLALSGPAAAERVFPPPHLSPDAQFSAGVNNGEKVASPWYEQNDASRKARLAAQENREPSPYPSMYYFYSIRGSANDESANLAGFRDQVVDEHHLTAND